METGPPLTILAVPIENRLENPKRVQINPPSAFCFGGVTSQGNLLVSHWFGVAVDSFLNCHFYFALVSSTMKGVQSTPRLIFLTQILAVETVSPSRFTRFGSFSRYEISSVWNS